jgi:hypothetical protein
LSHTPADTDVLARDAVKDDSGYTVERGFVDDYRYHAEDVAYKLGRIFETQGFSAGDERAIRDAVLNPDGPLLASILFLSGLLPWTNPLIEQLRADPSPRGRILALRAGEKLRPDVFPVEFFTDPDPEVRMVALSETGQKWRLGGRGSEDILNRVDRLLSDSVPAVRASAAHWHAYNGEPHNPAALIACLRDEPDAKVRREIVFALRCKINPSLGIPASVPWRDAYWRTLLQQRESDDPDIRRHAAAALEYMK